MNWDSWDGTTFVVGGREFAITTEYDDFPQTPWEYLGNGIVSDWVHRDKLPSERILSIDKRVLRYFNFAECVRQFREGGETGKRAAELADSTYHYCRRWCDDQWHYIVVWVAPMLDDGTPDTDRDTCISGVEDDNWQYVLDTAAELAREIIAHEETESREREFAQSLGIATVGA